MDIRQEIAELKASRKAVILAHNYERAEVQDVADFTGDSLELARKATEFDAEVIVFCGVYFMAETAKILNPSRMVLIPDATAGCAMADMVTGEDVRRFKMAHPAAKAVCYVNSTAEVKAECDMCVTSGNAEKVMATFKPGTEIFFVPDQHLGSYIADKLGTKYELWPGYCPVHARLAAERISEARAAHPGAPVLVHPECCKAVRDAADFNLSTGGMCRFARESEAEEFIVGTETGILHRLELENPGKKFYPLDVDIVCPDMKKVTLEKVRDSLRDLTVAVEVPKDVAIRARRSIEAMLAIT